MEKEAKKYTLYYARLGDVWPTRHETVFANSEEAAVKKAFLYVGEILHAVYPKLDTEGTEYNVTGTVYYVEPNAVGRLGESSKVTEEGVAKVSLASIEENVEAPHHSFLTVLGLVRDAKESSIALNDVLCKLRDRNLFPTGYEKVKFCDKGHMLTYRYKIKGEDAIIEAMEIIDLAGTAQIYYEERRKSLVVFVEFLNY